MADYMILLYNHLLCSSSAVPSDSAPDDVDGCCCCSCCALDDDDEGPAAALMVVLDEVSDCEVPVDEAVIAVCLSCRDSLLGRSLSRSHSSWPCSCLTLI